MRQRWLSLLSIPFFATACGGRHGGNAAPVPVIIDPHESQSFFPGSVDFSGRASDPEDGVLAPTAMRWEIRNSALAVVATFQGDTQTLALPTAGDYTAVLYAKDSKGKEASVTAPFHLSNTIAALSKPKNHSIVAIAAPVTIDGFAQTQAPGVSITTLTFVGIDEATNLELFRVPNTAPGGSTTFTATVTPSLPVGRFKIHLEVATTAPTEKAEDNVHVIADVAPQVAITSPANASRILPGAAIAFAGTASAADGKPVTIAWTSSITGPLSQALTFQSSTLPAARHRIDLTATNSNGLSATASIDLYVENPSSPLFVSVASLPNSSATALALEGSGASEKIWVGTASGIASYTTATAVQASTITTGYNTNGQAETISALVSSTGERLFGGNNIGVSILNAAGATWSTYDKTTTLSDDVVHAIAQDPGTNDLFFATDAGITHTNAARTTATTLATGALNGTVWALAFAPDGTIWAGTDGNDLVHLTLPSTISVVTNLASSVVTAVAIDAAGNVWAGTDNGLSRVDHATQAVTDASDLVPGKKIFALKFDANGILWAGTDKGAARIDVVNQRTTALDGADLAGREIDAVVIDGSGAKWFAGVPGGPNPGGLTRYIGQ